MDVLSQLLLIIFLVVLNAFFAASEYAIVAVRGSRIDELAKKGDFLAKLIQSALKKREEYIFTTQVGTTIVSLILGWIGQPILARVFVSLFTFLPPGQILIAANALSVILSLILLTFISIMFGELVPKTVTLYRPERIAFIVITPLVIVVKMFKPIVGVLNVFNSIILRRWLGFRFNEDSPRRYSKEEIRIILDQLGQSGDVKKGGTEMMQNVVSLSDKTIKSIMTPRTEIAGIEVNATLSTILRHVKESYSRYPVYKKSLDNIIGFIHTKDIYKRMAMGVNENIQLANMLVIRNVFNVRESKKADEVLLDMRNKHIHMAAVYDEFGIMVGIVTLEDIIESLVGDIQDEFDSPIKGIHRNSDGTYIIDGNMTVENLQKRFRLAVDLAKSHEMIGTLVSNSLGHEPNPGDELKLGGHFFEVISMQGKRIKRLRLTRQPK